jgi:2-oxo-3-hexenedioate decarboxylase/2-keto-4-pentenoate hydratase
MARAVDIMSQNRVRPLPLEGLPADCRPPDGAAAYVLQGHLSRRLTELGFGPPAGWKIGCTTAVMQRFLGIDAPCAGTVHERGLKSGGAGRFRRADFNRPGVECEIAVVLAQPLPAAAAPFDRASVGKAVGAAMAAIEVVDDRWRDFRQVDTPTLIADDFFHAALVVGEPRRDWRTLDLAATRGVMRIDGREVGTGRGADVLGHPLEALAWLANALARRGRGLPPGCIVTLGSIVETRWVAEGAVVEVEVEGLGGARATF